jgi:DNA-binding NarL/FixJ family response regulator
MNAGPVRVVVVDDLPVIRSGWAAFLRTAQDIHMIGEASDGEDAVQLCGLVMPDVVLMDLKMPRMDGVAATRLITQRWPQIKVLVLGNFRDHTLVQQAVEAGAAGYLVKDITAEGLVAAIRQAQAGERMGASHAAKELNRAEHLKLLEYELRNPWQDASELTTLLRQHLPELFPGCQMRVRIYPAQDLEVSMIEGVTCSISEPAWKWLRNNPHTQVYLPGDSYPWTGRQPEDCALTLASIRTNNNAKPLGGMGLVNSQPVLDDPTAARTIETLAGMLAQSISTAQGRARALWPANLAYELSEAARIQASILPKESPKLAGWDISARLQPARETSGDFYDFIPLPNGNLGIVIADVTDKGMGAAMFMALSSTLIRTYALQYPTLPGFAMSIVNDRILSDTHGSMFVTAFFGVLEPHTGRLRYVNAGHPPPLMVSSTKGKPVDQLRATGMALGMVEKATWQQKVVKFSPGDVLLLYTDGITEAQNQDGEDFGDDNLFDVLLPRRSCSAEDLQNSVFEAVNHFTSNQATGDDIAVMVVCRKK